MHETLRRDAEPLHVLAGISFFLAVLPVLLVGVVLLVDYTSSDVLGFWMGSCVLAVVGAVMGLVSGRTLLRNGHESPWYAKTALPLGLLSPFISAGMGFLGMLNSWSHHYPFG